MIYFEKTEESRLVQVRALSGDFPFYGKLETIPGNAATEFREGGGVLVEENLLIQYNAQVGDPIRIGKLKTTIAGRLRKVPGETVAFATISPRVYLSMADLPKTDLLRPGSVARYRIYFKLEPATNVPRLVETIRPQLDRLRLAYNTVEKRKKDLGSSMENFNNYLSLVGFVALLLGGIGIASALHAHLQQKFNTIAVLRCLGCSVSQTFAIYLWQGLALGMAGTLAGAILGVLIHLLLPRVMADFLPLAASHAVSWSAVSKAMIIGLSISLLFTVLPLLSVRLISPLAVIRSFYERPARHDPLLSLAYAAIASSILLFSMFHAENWRAGVGFAAGLGAAYALLFGLAKLLMTLAKQVLRPSFPFVWKQGIANLYRPHNRTVLTTVSLGLGAFLVLTLYLTQQLLLNELSSSNQRDQADLVLFDIQTDQKEAIAALIQSRHLKVADEAPVVTMRIASLKGVEIESLLGDKKEAIPHWALRHEYRSSYHNRLRSGEKIVAGQWVSKVDRGASVNPIPISIEEGIAKDLRVGLGDEIVFDVQGVPLRTKIASVREVDWRRVQPNFFVVFPQGCLEEAPAFHVMTLRVNSPEQSAALQREVVQRFPNVSAIELTLILQTVEAILNKISMVIRFMAVFTVGTGLLVLTGAILTGRFQRIRESILLRTLGASRAQILNILVIEYLCLGVLSALIGMLLAVTASWALSIWVFHVHFKLFALPLFIALALICAITTLIGLLASRGILNHPPLAVLRAET